VWGVDRDGAINLIDEAEAEGIERFVMLSSIGADRPEDGPEELARVPPGEGRGRRVPTESDLTYTIVRPGPLTNEDGTGRIRIDTDLDGDDAEIRARTSPGRWSRRSGSRARTAKRSNSRPATSRSRRRYRNR